MISQLFFALSGLISGVVSYFIITADSGPNGGLDLLFYVPGVAFGVAVGIAVISFRHVNILWGIPWVVASAASYYAAVYTTLRVIDGKGESVAAQYSAFFIGGSVGAFLMLAGFHLLLSRLQVWQFLLLTLAGGVFGLSWFLGGMFPGLFSGSDVDANLFFLFAVWQTLMALGLGYATSRQEQENVIR